jgi:hypothetical protein
LAELIDRHDAATVSLSAIRLDVICNRQIVEAYGGPMRNPWKLTSLFLAVLLVVVIGRNAIQTASADPQPNMKDALSSLESALGSLDKATPDKGGHRKKAMTLTKSAIAEVKKGIAFDNKH